MSVGSMPVCGGFAWAHHASRTCVSSDIRGKLRPDQVAGLLATLLLILVGCLACAYGALIFASIDTSDTATGALVTYGLTLAVPGVAAVAAADLAPAQALD